LLARLWRLLEPRERRRVAWVVPFLVVSALVEVAGVAAVLPFLSLLTAPGSIELPAWLASRVPFDAADDAALFRWVGGLLAGVVVLANGLLMATSYWLLRFSWGLNHAISARLLRHYLAQPYAFLLTRNTSVLANRVVVVVRQAIDQGVQASLEIVTRSVVVLALVTFLVLLDPATALVAFVAIGGLYGVVFVSVRRYLRRIGVEVVATADARMKAVDEALGGFKDLRVTGREASAYRRYLGPSQRYGDVQAAGQAVLALPRYALEAVAVGGLVLIAALMAGRGDAMAGILPLLGVYAFAGLRLMPAMQTLFTAVGRLRFASGSLDALEEDFAHTEALEPVDEDEPAKLHFERAIELRNVTFAYPGWEEPALAGVSLTIERRRSVAIVGRTGSGKTTLIDVLLGLLEPQSGAVLVDGAPLAPAQRRSYRRLFGYVPQTIYLLDDTIARNIAFGVEDDRIDLEAVRRACREAQIADFIEHELPDGYRTEVGERGVRLSGGQRQRLGIARALYHQPDVLLFDEATSALDVHTEQQVYDALAGIAEQRTVVTIAHRLETVAKADRVVVLERGRVVDTGPPTEVLRRYRGEIAVAG
jgi:ATP-binding cassette, subfamily B, bacterial PglK